ncbi:MAG TPA: hypothetical protein VMF52_00690 [Steroidobacteraceae bacterium]|nr:hypothetical protein [Steroidobacteraceae bacterium]
MIGRNPLLLLVLLPSLVLPGVAAADDPAPPKELRRGGMALAVEAGYGGDSLEGITESRMRAGQGISAMVGGFYRPRADSPLEIYGLAGYRLGFAAPVIGGGYYENTKTPVLEVLANYRFDNKWYVAGGLVSHLSPRITSNDPEFHDIRFDTAVGATVEAGWSFIGVYATYLEYSGAGQHLDASSVGLRFTMRLRKWRPVH